MIDRELVREALVQIIARQIFAAAEGVPIGAIDQVDPVLTEDGASVALYVYGVSGRHVLAVVDLPAPIRDPSDFNWREWRRALESELQPRHSTDDLVHPTPVTRRSRCPARPRPARSSRKR